MDKWKLTKDFKKTNSAKLRALLKSSATEALNMLPCKSDTPFPSKTHVMTILVLDISKLIY